MADSKISDLSAATTLADTDLFVIAQEDTANKKILWSTVKSEILAADFLRVKDYVQFTSNVACTATSAATANTIVTGSSITYNGSEAILVIFFCSGYAASTTANTCHIEVYDGSSNISQIANTRAPNTSIDAPIFACYRIVPTAAAHTYSIRGWIDTSGTFTIVGGTGGAATPAPGFILILGLG